ncbi:MAG: lamin tail domain-containing protein [Promethearchaeota archaeon]
MNLISDDTILTETRTDDGLNIVNSAVPEIRGGLVWPDSGDQNTVFNFQVTYVDDDNDAPTFVRVLLKAESNVTTAHLMSKMYSTDTDYTDGCIYQYFTQLNPANYTFWFEGNDGSTTENTSVFNLEVVQVNEHAPELYSPIVTPIIGDTSTLFTFSVLYFDADNDLPDSINITINETTSAMSAADPLDTNVIDGKEYIFSTTLAIFGQYHYKINCSDGKYMGSTSWISQPEVDPFKIKKSDSILINEVNSGFFDFIELVNFGNEKTLTGWYVEFYHNNALDYTYYFPTGYVFRENFVLALNEGTGTDSELDIFINHQLFWASGGIAVALKDDNGRCVDWFQTSVYSGPVPGDANWINDVSLQLNNNDAHRVSDLDEDKASDWLVSGTSSKNVLTPTQRAFAMPISPNNATTYSPSNITFYWDSMELSFGAVNFTLQMSNTSDFSTIVLENTSLPEAAGTSSVTLNLSTFSSGDYYWRVKPVYGSYEGAWSGYITLKLRDTSTNHAPVLTDGQVFPENGDQNTLFTFQVTYTDLDNNPPQGGGGAYIRVRINGSSYAMTKMYPSDNDYTDGCIYQYSTYLAPNLYRYEFYFECSDSLSTANTSAQRNPLVNYVNDNPPELRYPVVNPIRGICGDTYTFSVWYYDADNNLPQFINVTINGTLYSLIQTDPGDTSVVDGKSYYRQVTLTDPGQYFYNISAYDGQYSDSINNILGPDVQPFYSTSSVSLLMPTNNASFYPQPVTFTWDDMNLACGMVNFTWQLSDVKDFSNIIMENTSIPELATHGEITRLINLSKGVYYWRVRPQFNQYIGDWSDPFNFTMKRNDNLPTLANPSVTPTTGNQNTIFTFSVTYQDLDNEAPTYVRLFLNGSLISMNKLYPGDNDYTDGCIYVYSASLSPPSYPATYEYYFEASSSSNITNTMVFTGPSLTFLNSYAPELLSPMVSPEADINGTEFSFSVIFLDQDNNSAQWIRISINGTWYSLIQKDPLDLDTTDGKLYEYNITLNVAGYYRYRFNCSDGAHEVITSWYNGPIANPLLEASNNKTVFSDDFESGLGKWSVINSLWHLTSASSSWPNPYHSFNHSMWFGQESSGDFNTGSAVSGDLISVPIDMTGIDQAYLEYYNWREGEGGSYDLSTVYISTNGVSWTTLTQYNGFVSPWQKVIINISSYCGNATVQIRFYFDSMDSIANTYHGWNVDDVKIYTNGTSLDPVPVPVSPNGTTLVPGNITFTWGKVYLSSASVHYDWQLSNTSTFSSILMENVSIPDAPSMVSLTRDVSLADGKYYWRVRTVAGIFKSEWSKSVFFFIKNSSSPPHVPMLTDGSVSPTTGDTTTTFTYTVVYTDLDNDAPWGSPGAYIHVIINGSSHSMTKMYPSDNDYTDGCIYVYSTTLAQDPYQYQFYFECNDSVYQANTTLLDGPLVNNPVNHAPSLVNPLVTPEEGNGNTIMVFQVTYFDEDNDFPSQINVTINGSVYFLISANGSDNNVVDGKIYFTILYLAEAEFPYQFQFNATDGEYSVFTSVLTGPLVQPYLEINKITLRTPDNESRVLSGNVTFSWDSLSLASGPTNYTLQISNTSDFSNIVVSITDIVETPSTTSINVTLDQEVGIYYWRVQPYRMPYKGEWSDYNIYYLEKNVSTPVLSAPSLSPSGEKFSDTQLTFSVVYTDADNKAPEVIQVVIDGLAFPMEKENSSDLLYFDGCLYVFQGYLEPGDHEFYFYAEDLAGSVTTAPVSFKVKISKNPAAVAAGLDNTALIIVIIGVAIAAGVFAFVFYYKKKHPSLLGSKRRNIKPTPRPLKTGSKSKKTAANKSGKLTSAAYTVLKCPHCGSSWQIPTSDYNQKYKGKEISCTKCHEKFTPS